MIIVYLYCLYFYRCIWCTRWFWSKKFVQVRTFYHWKIVIW